MFSNFRNFWKSEIFFGEKNSGLFQNFLKFLSIYKIFFQSIGRTKKMIFAIDGRTPRQKFFDKKIFIESKMKFLTEYFFEK